MTWTRPGRKRIFGVSQCTQTMEAILQQMVGALPRIITCVLPIMMLQWNTAVGVLCSSPGNVTIRLNLATNAVRHLWLLWAKLIHGLNTLSGLTELLM